jgi:hypothetical protein
MKKAASVRKGMKRLHLAPFDGITRIRFKGSRLRATLSLRLPSRRKLPRSVRFVKSPREFSLYTTNEERREALLSRRESGRVFRRSIIAFDRFTRR